MLFHDIKELNELYICRMYKYNSYQNIYKALENEYGTFFNFWYKSPFLG